MIDGALRVVFGEGDPHDDALALLVGRIVLESSTLDYELAHVIVRALGGEHDSRTWERYMGESGQALIKGLDSAAERNADVSPLAKCMRSVVERRNQVVHGLVFLDPANGPGAYEIVRPQRRTASDSDDRLVTTAMLAELHADIRALGRYAEVLNLNLAPLYQYPRTPIAKQAWLALPPLDGVCSGPSWPTSDDA